MMSAVRNRDTGPERVVRATLFSHGYRYRLHRKDLPGSPDIVLPLYRTVVFVHGCFWHGHGCSRGRRPASNIDFWNTKLDRNLARDRRDCLALEAAGWRVVIIWECEIADGTKRLLAELDSARQGRRWARARELTK